VTKRKPRSPRWRCFECGVTGIGGAAEFTAHWISTHNEPPF
jgi:hypothetical protein